MSKKQSLRIFLGISTEFNWQKLQVQRWYGVFGVLYLSASTCIVGGNSLRGQDAIFSVPEDRRPGTRGPRTQGPETHGPELAYTVRIRVSYIRSTCICNCLSGMH